jgi:hypothetical protein
MTFYEINRNDEKRIIKELVGLYKSGSAEEELTELFRKGIIEALRNHGFPIDDDYAKRSLQDLVMALINCPILFNLNLFLTDIIHTTAEFNKLFKHLSKQQKPAPNIKDLEEWHRWLFGQVPDKKKAKKIGNDLRVSK